MSYGLFCLLLFSAVGIFYLGDFDGFLDSVHGLGLCACRFGDHSSLALCLCCDLSASRPSVILAPSVILVSEASLVADLGTELLEVVASETASKASLVWLIFAE